MVKLQQRNDIPFTTEHIKSKNLVIEMLKYENDLILGPIGKEIYSNFLFKPRISLTPEYSIHRKVLTYFNFDTSDESVNNYRSIFKYYYHSPTNYDKDVLSSVVYMRENKLVYYTSPSLKLGQIIPDCPLWKIDGTTKTSLYDTLGNDFNYAFVAAYSLS